MEENFLCETSFNKRLRKVVSAAWLIFQNKVGNSSLKINKEGLCPIISVKLNDLDKKAIIPPR